MKSILVTGGTGYIGSHTIVALLMQGYDVISIDNYHNSFPTIIELIKKIVNREFIHYEGDCTDFIFLEKMFSQHAIDGIIHFAAMKSVPESLSHPLQYYHVNINATLELLKAAHTYNVNKFIFSSTCALYDPHALSPVDEYTQVSLESTPYGLSKLFCENILRTTASQSNIKVLALRYFNPAGNHPSGILGEWPRNKSENLFPCIIDALLHDDHLFTIYGNDYDTPDGTCVRDFIHVMDLAEAHIAALSYLDTPSIPFDIINLGSEKGFSVLDVVQTFETVLNSPLSYIYGPRRKGDIASIYSSCKKAKELLHWQCKYNLEDMCRSALLWKEYRSKISSN